MARLVGPVTKIVIVFLVSLEASCGAVQDQSMSDSEPALAEGGVEHGVECTVVRGDDGSLFSFSGPLAEELQPGQRVRLYGTRTDMSFCMQGQPVAVTRVEPLQAG